MYPNKIIAVDFETTGLVSMYDSPTAVGLVLMEDGVAKDEFFLRIMPSKKCKLSLEALFVQAGDEARLDVELLVAMIRKIFSADAVPGKEAMRLISAWADSVGAAHIPNVAQNASFDWGFFANQLAVNTTAYDGSALSPTWICTKAMARRKWRKASLKDTSLAKLAEMLGVTGRAGTEHDALEDAYLCGQIYFKLRDEIITWKDEVSR